MNKEDFKKIIPGFTMGVVRATISHPFEIMKLKSQIGNKQSLFKNLFKGLHYSILTNGLERGIQFGLYEKFKLNDNNLNSSAKASLISTSLTLPYNIILLRNVVMKSSIKIPKYTFYKSLGLEYTRNLSGSILFLSSYNYLKDSNCPLIIRAPLASCFVWGITYPIDAYKNILISGNNNIISFKSLYRGIQYPLIRSIPSSIVGFYVYEYMLDICK
tara:strand:- start:481 stop:1128 length:648 start_codon:yes stop_codon:yes gene_type:complete